eukprot:XP_019925439.1 PREDICTED: uncharacterized protein LOC105334635 [Crassostrea gigas]
MAVPLLLSALLLVTSLGFVTNDAIGKYEYNYSVNREKVHQQERDFAGYPTDYTEDEQIVQNYLEYLKWMEFQKTKDDFYPARPIKLHLSDIKASEIYRVLKKFPKGGNLHLHHNHVVSKSTILDFIYKNPYLLDNFYVRESPEPNKWRFNFYLNPPTGWVKVKDNPKYTKDVIIEHSTFLGVIDDKALSSPTISGLRWKEMNPLFSTLGSAIVNQINVSRFHMEAMFQSAIDECTLWMHIRKQRYLDIYLLMAKEVVLVPKEKYQKLLENQERISNSEFENNDLNFIGKDEKKNNSKLKDDNADLKQEKTVKTDVEWVEPSISPTTKDLRGVDDTKASAPDDREDQSMKNLNSNISTNDSANLVVYKTPANIVKRQKTSAKNISRKGWLRYK